MVQTRRTAAAFLGFACIQQGLAEDTAKSIEARFAELEHLVHIQEETLSRQADKLNIDALRIEAMEKPQERRLHADDINGALDHMWLLLCGALVMMMQSGFALVAAGCCRAKNVQNILLKNVADVAVGTLGWWACGYAFAYGDPVDNGFIGHKYFFGSGFLETDDAGNQNPIGGKMRDWFFQWAFCSAAATIVSGGVAERVNFAGYCIFSFAMSSFIYPVVVAWTWGYGWLSSGGDEGGDHSHRINDIGFMDFAGSGIVHMTGGVGALIGAAVAGSRSGRWERPDEFHPHSLPLIVLGTFILWFGWYGFNCGSTLGLHDKATGEVAAQVAMNSTISAATGGLVVFCLRLGALKLYDMGGFCNGILGGLVSITAGCGNVDCGSAFAIGMIGGIIYESASRLLKIIKVDDPIDAFAVHGACGMWGVLAAAIFDWGKGFSAVHGWGTLGCTPGDDNKCEDDWGKLFAANLLEIICIASWSCIWSLIVFAPLRFSGILRASDLLQEAGMDSKHSPPKAYSA